MIELTQVMLQTTVGQQADAQALARLAVQGAWAACVHVEPIQSVYRWQGEVQEDAEWRLSFKTTQERLPALLEALKAHHPYELPAFYTLTATPLTPQWAQWVQDAVDPSS